MSPLSRAFLEIAKEEGNTSSIEAIRNAAFAKIAAGEIKTLISSTLNGKSFSYSVSKPADEIFVAATWAIRQYNQGVITVTQLDFSNI